MKRFINIFFVTLLPLMVMAQNVTTQSTKTSSNRSTTGTINGHEWVDLGLSVKWATCNVGASSPSECGDYFAWGETSTKSEYTEKNCNTHEKKMRNIAGNSQYDAARVHWGSTWRLPTKKECKELVKKCTWTWTSQGGNNGYLVSSKKNGNSIFLPAAGWHREASVNHDGEYGVYWSSTPKTKSGAYFLYFQSFFFDVLFFNRYSGYPIRPVSE